MPDDADRAQERMEREAPYLMAAAKKPVLYRPNGQCHNCFDEVHEGQLYCDDFCRADFEKRHMRGLR